MTPGEKQRYYEALIQQLRELEGYLEQVEQVRANIAGMVVLREEGGQWYDKALRRLDTAVDELRHLVAYVSDGLEG